MKVTLYTCIVSPHQLPLAREILCTYQHYDFKYIYTESLPPDAGKRGWHWGADESWMQDARINNEATRECLTTSDLVLSTERDIPLFGARSLAGKRTLYASERWLKPGIGLFRLMHPRYAIMAWRFIKLLRKCDGLMYLPIGVHAARDMARLCGLFSGDLMCLFRTPALEFEKKPGGKIWLKGNPVDQVGHAEKRYCLDKMRMWGYFVEPSLCPIPHSSTSNSSTLRVLWVGRFLKWKRVDTVIRAVGELSTCSRCSTRITLDVYGTGPEEKRLKNMAAKYGDVIRFYPPVPISEVRKLMSEHDIYVLASNAYEGWGAVVSEALEEGMKVIGTYEAGGSATILPRHCLFHAGDWQSLMRILQNKIPSVGIGRWSVKDATQTLMAFME